MTPVLSFILPVRNDAARLRRCLETIVSSDSGTPAEIVVVDNGSTDRSADVARASGARVIVLSDERVSALRNAGARAAAAEILAFVDADHELAPGWITAAVAMLGDPAVGAVGAQYHAPVDGTWVQRMYDRLRRRQPGHHQVDWLPSGNIVVRRHAFASIGGFDESLVTCEDVDFCQRLREEGWRLVEAEELRSVHHGDPATLGALFRGELWRGQDNLRVSLRGRGAVRDWLSAMFPMAMLVALTGVAVGSVIVLFGIGWPLLTGLALLTAVVGTRAAFLIGRTPRSERSVSRACQALIVGFVYDVARACALVVHPPHDLRQSTPSRP